MAVDAPGYGPMNGWAAELIRQDVADTVGTVLGLGFDTPRIPAALCGAIDFFP